MALQVSFWISWFPNRIGKITGVEVVFFCVWLRFVIWSQPVIWLSQKIQIKFIHFFYIVLSNQFIWSVILLDKKFEYKTQTIICEDKNPHCKCNPTVKKKEKGCNNHPLKVIFIYRVIEIRRKWIMHQAFRIKM